MRTNRGNQFSPPLILEWLDYQPFEFTATGFPDTRGGERPVRTGLNTSGPSRLRLIQKQDPQLMQRALQQFRLIRIQIPLRLRFQNRQ